MRNKLLVFGSVLLMIICTIACTKTGDCTVEINCDKGFQSSTTAFDIEEGECVDLAADYESNGECTVDYDWIVE